MEENQTIINTENQIVYVFTNPAMPDLVKIGKTSKQDINERLKELYTTGVPAPFECAFACLVKNAAEVEKALHFAFGDFRFNPKREFFRIDPDKVIAVLKLLKVDDITMQIEENANQSLSESDKQTMTKYKNIRPNLDFIEIGIPMDSIITLKKDSSITAKIVGHKKVEFEGIVCSLSAATKKALELPDDYSIQGSPHWIYEGKSLKEIYDEYHSN